jgi:selenocysteine-specific elongation factor
VETVSEEGDLLRAFDFDGVVNSWPSPAQKSIRGNLILGGRDIPVSVYLYEEKGGNLLQGPFFVRVHATHPVGLKWMDPFQIRDRKRGAICVEGKALSPCEGSIKKREIKKRLEFLRDLVGGEKEMILTNAKAVGVKGLTEKELFAFSPLSKDTLLSLSKELEGDGEIRILSFSPLFLLSQGSFDFLCTRILAFLSDYHKKHPDDFGISPERIQKRFGLSPRVCALALKHLSRTGQVLYEKRNVTLFDFHPHPSPEEEKLLGKMEEMYFEGKLRSVSMDEIQKRFRLSKKKLNRMLSFLVVRQKIVLGKDRFFVHSKWLDEVILAIRESKKKDLSVSDFKRMTGLTRKYAIPLLELLDQMGVTRRIGPTREIIRDVDNKG